MYLFLILIFFLNTCIDSLKRGFGVLTFDSLIPPNVSSLLVPNISRHAPGHSVCYRTMCGGRDLCIISESGIRIFTQKLESEDDDRDTRRLDTVAANATVDARWKMVLRVV